jgi:hypothetical protein
MPAIRAFVLGNPDFWLTLQKMAHPWAKKCVNLQPMYQMHTNSAVSTFEYMAHLSLKNSLNLRPMYHSGSQYPIPNIRADFPCFGLKIVVHSHYLPRGDTTGNWAQCSTGSAPMIELWVQSSIKNRWSASKRAYLQVYFPVRVGNSSGGFLRCRRGRFSHV